MEKIRNVLSHGQAKEGNAAQAESDRSQTGRSSGEGSHQNQTGPSQSTQGTSGEYHPIYDQFTKGQTTGAATSNLQPNQHRPAPQDDVSTASIKSGVIGFPQGSDDAHAARPNNNLFEQKKQEAHGSNQPGAGGDLSGTKKPGDQAPQLGQVAAAGAGLLQTSDDKQAANPNDNLLEQKKEEAHGSNQPGQGGDLSGTKPGDHAGNKPPQITLQRQESDVPPDSGRSFPLAGGVAHQFSEKATKTSTREPGTKEKEAATHHGQGREGLAGAAAAATPSSAIPQNDGVTEANLKPSSGEQSAPKHNHGRDAAAAGGLGAAGVGAYEAAKHHQSHDSQPETSSPSNTTSQPAAASQSTSTSQPSTASQPTATSQPAAEHHYGRDAAAAGGLGAAGIGAYEAAKHHQSQTSQPTTTAQPANPDAVAAARAAVDEHGWTHDHGGHGHKYEGDPCESSPVSPEERQSGLLFTSGPHSTDTANRIDPKLHDPKLHIPGEFPSPTPVEESNAPSYLQSKPTTATSPSAFAEPELRHTGTLDEPQSRSADKSASEHHYGRDAAVAGGLGAAGAGALAAGKHSEKGSADIDNEPLYSETNPYTHTKVDPRVDTVPKGGFAEQRFDPTASESRTSRNAPLTGGVIGSSQPSTSVHQAPEGRELASKEYPLAGQDVKADSQHHYGRDTALVGAGAATTAGLYASQRQAEPDSGPASSTIGPHESNIANVLDPRVQPDPDVQKNHYAAPTVEDPAPSTVGPHKSDVANIVDPRVLPDPQKQKAIPKDEMASNIPGETSKEHHYGRDAAIAGGAGVAGYGAYEAAKSYDEHASTQPAASMNEQRYDPLARGAHDPRSTAAAQEKQHHCGRDAAAVGGVGALGAGAYTATQAQSQSSSHQRYDSAQLPQDSEEDHSKRNVALGTAAGAAAGAGGAYAYSQHDAQKEHERQLKEQQKAFDDQQKAMEKKQAHDQKHHDKLVVAEEKKHQKEAERKEKEHAKELEKQQKESDKIEQHREATPESEEGSPKEKKHRFLTFLNKKDKDKTGHSGENSPRGSRDSPRHSKEYAAAGVGAGAAGAAAYEHEEGKHLGEKKGRNVLRKDPPAGHPARDADAHVGSVGKREHIGTDGPIGDPDLVSGDRQTRAGVYGAHPAEDVITGHHTVKEPHTGLPMNVERYGDGAGGTDGSATVHAGHVGEGTTDWEAIKKGDTVF